VEKRKVETHERTIEKLEKEIRTLLIKYPYRKVVMMIEQKAKPIKGEKASLTQKTKQKATPIKGEKVTLTQKIKQTCTATPV